VRREIITVYQ